MKTPPLDILLYAHDGRGLGHASRSIAIGMGLRRLYPGLKVLLVTGCRQSSELIGPAPLDWLKLPSYETEVRAGSSRGIEGKSRYQDKELGVLRAAQLEQLLLIYRPRLVLVDHTPQGKHRELLPALAVSRQFATKWVLGVRGVVGSVPQASSTLARQLFDDYYSDLLWYGDSAVLGRVQLDQLADLYSLTGKECGYVSRMSEVTLLRQGERTIEKAFAGTIAVPWLGEKSITFLQEMALALKNIGPKPGIWRLFIDPGETLEDGKAVHALFANIEYCQVEPLSGKRYNEALLASRSAVIYGGYNSTMDVLSAALPAIVVIREMQDKEQDIHLRALKKITGEQLQLITETTATARQLSEMLCANLQCSSQAKGAVQLDGAQRAARHLAAFLGTDDLAGSG